MQHLTMIGLLCFLFFCEGSLFQWLAPDVWGADWTIVPSLSLTVMLIFSIYSGPMRGLLYGIGLGFLHDLAFGYTIGIDLFSYACVGYFCGLFAQQFQRQWLLVVLTVMLAVACQLAIAYGLYWLFGVTEMPWKWMLYREWLPSIVFNGLFALLCYWPLKRLLTIVGLEIEKV